jgi:hypothetical protein
MKRQNWQDRLRQLRRKSKWSRGEKRKQDETVRELLEGKE